MIKIFQVDDTDWYAAETMEEAIAEAMRLTGEDRAFYEEGTPGEVSDEAMDCLHFIEEDGIEKDIQAEAGRDDKIREKVSPHFCDVGILRRKSEIRIWTSYFRK